MKNISLILAFSAGLLSFLSPCVIPLVPGYISYLTGSSIEDLKDGKTKLYILYKSLGFVLGFSTVFILMGISITSISKILITYRIIFRKISGVLIIIFGLHTIGVFKIKLLYYEKRFLQFDKIKGSFSSIVMGITFAAGWTPCIGPILSSILIYASNMDSIGKGILLLIMYSLGLSIPFILTAMVIESFCIQFKKFSKYLPVISIISGIFMILMGIIIFTNKLSQLSQFSNFINF